MKRFFAIIVLCLWSSFCYAQGWLPLAYAPPLPLLDNFNRYANNTVMSGQVPVNGPAWLTTGANLPTINNGLLVDAGTGYLYTNLTSAPPTLGAKFSFSGGSSLSQLPIAMALSSQTPPTLHIQSLVHYNFGPQSFILGNFDSGGTFTSLMTGSWATPLSNGGAISETFICVSGSTATVIGPGGTGVDQFSVTDPNIALNFGPMVFWEPNLEADGLQGQISQSYALNTNKCGPAGTTKFNPADKLATITLSNGNLTSTANATVFPNEARSIAGRTNGKVHVEWTNTNHQTPGSQNLAFGFSSFASHALNASNGLGGDFKSVGIYPTTTNTTAFLGNSGTNFGSMGGSTGDTWAMEVDFGAAKIWFKNVTQNTGWNNDILANQNPATGTGGYNIAGLGGPPYGLTVEIDTLNDAITINTGGSPYALTPSPGFSNWLFLLKRDLDPAANDNDPMWLERAA